VVRLASVLVLVFANVAGADVSGVGAAVGAPGLREAVAQHKEAQRLKRLALASWPPDEKLIAAAHQAYSRAVEGYQRSLPAIDSAADRYEYTFFLGEALFYSERFEEAATAYEQVRDWRGDNRYHEDAAFNAVKAREHVVERRVAAGAIAPPEPSAQPQPIPDELARLQVDYDQFARVVPASGRAPGFLYKAAEIDVRYGHQEEARARLARIIRGGEQSETRAVQRPGPRDP
jgi:hypothetical protein